MLILCKNTAHYSIVTFC